MPNQLLDHPQAETLFLFESDMIHKLMSSKQQFQRYDTTIGIGIVALLIIGIMAGFVLKNWTIIESWLPPMVIGILIVLFYRLVVAVEHLAYDA
jgi:hypothetical protein